MTSALFLTAEFPRRTLLGDSEVCLITDMKRHQPLGRGSYKNRGPRGPGARRARANSTRRGARSAWSNPCRISHPRAPSRIPHPRGPRWISDPGGSLSSGPRGSLSSDPRGSLSFDLWGSLSSDPRGSLSSDLWGSLSRLSEAPSRYPRARPLG